MSISAAEAAGLWRWGEGLADLAQDSVCVCVCVCVCVDHLFAKVTCAGGHSTCYQGMANEEPGSKVLKTYLQ